MQSVAMAHLAITSVVKALGLSAHEGQVSLAYRIITFASLSMEMRIDAGELPWCLFTRSTVGVDCELASERIMPSAKSSKTRSCKGRLSVCRNLQIVDLSMQKVSAALRITSNKYVLRPGLDLTALIASRSRRS